MTRTMIFIIMLCILSLEVALVQNIDFVDMKIVEEPSSLGFQQSFGYNYMQSEEPLVARMLPANFSGPLHFKRLIGRCFHSVINDYKYSFCPYSNITQHEQNVHWNPYKGVLGVWQEWEVNDNTFTAMLMKDGDACGDIFRSVRVIFVCGNRSKVMNTTEPERCNYELLFMTPLVCAKDSMLVYPSLTSDLRHEWDLLMGEQAVGDLTKKGYKRKLRSIFEKAGIYLSENNYNKLKKNEEAVSHSVKDGDFGNLESCNSAFRSLKLENEGLKHELEVLKANSNSHGGAIQPGDVPPMS